MSDDNFIDEWLQYLDEQSRSANTIAGYRRGLEHFQRWYMQTYGDAEFNPAGVLPKDFKDWISFQNSVERTKPATTNLRVAAVRQFFTWLHETGQISRNPAANAKFLDLDNSDFKGLDEQAYKRFMRAVYEEEDPRNIAIIEAMVGAGLRVGEVLDLQVGDLVLRERETRDNFSYIIVREGKGGKRRTIPMSRDVKAAMLKLMESHPKRDDPAASLWTGQRGSLSERSTISRLLSRYSTRAGLPPVNPHALRHTFAHRWLEKNPGDIRTLADILGHSDIKTTMKYTVPSDAEKASKMAKM